MKITKDLFVWKIISYKMAIKLCWESSIPVYILHEDESESLVDSEEILDEAYENKAVLAIEVGQLDFRDLAIKQEIIPIFWSKEDIRNMVDEDDDSYNLTEDEVGDVFSDLERYHDAEIGISWDVIKYHIQNVVEKRNT